MAPCPTTPPLSIPPYLPHPHPPPTYPHSLRSCFSEEGDCFLFLIPRFFVSPHIFHLGCLFSNRFPPVVSHWSNMHQCGKLKSSPRWRAVKKVTDKQLTGPSKQVFKSEHTEAVPRKDNSQGRGSMRKVAFHKRIFFSRNEGMLLYYSIRQQEGSQLLNVSPFRKENSPTIGLLVESALLKILRATFVKTPPIRPFKSRELLSLCQCPLRS